MNVVNDRKCILSNIFFLIQRTLCGDRSSVIIFRRRTLVVNYLSSMRQTRLRDHVFRRSFLPPNHSARQLHQRLSRRPDRARATVSIPRLKKKQKLTKHTVIDEIAALTEMNCRHGTID